MNEIRHFVRFRAARAGLVKARDFRYGESADVPPEVTVPNRNLMNLLELPVLFYVVCLGYYVTGTADTLALVLAWGYVVPRAVHSATHLTYNNVFHRLRAFAASNIVLIALWIRWAIALVQAAWRTLPTRCPSRDDGPALNSFYRGRVAVQNRRGVVTPHDSTLEEGKTCARSAIKASRRSTAIRYMAGAIS